MLLFLLGSSLAVVARTQALSVPTPTPSAIAVPVQPTAGNTRNCSSLSTDANSLNVTPDMLDCLDDLIQGDCRDTFISYIVDPSALPQLSACVVSNAPGLDKPDMTAALDTRAKGLGMDFGRCLQEFGDAQSGNLTAIFDVSACIANFVTPCVNSFKNVLPISLLTLPSVLKNLEVCVRRITQGPIPANGEYCLPTTHEYNEGSTTRVYLQYCLKVSNSQADLIMKLSWPQYKRLSIWWNANSNHYYYWFVESEGKFLVEPGIRRGEEASSGVTVNVGTVSYLISAGTYKVDLRYMQRGPDIGNKEMDVHKEYTFDIPAA